MSKEKLTILRPSVQKFAIRMERRLRENEHFPCYNSEWLFRRLKDEVRELQQRLNRSCSPRLKTPALEEIRRDAISIATFAMMIAGRYKVEHAHGEIPNFNPNTFNEGGSISW